MILTAMPLRRQDHAAGHKHRHHDTHTAIPRRVQALQGGAPPVRLYIPRPIQSAARRARTVHSSAPSTDALAKSPRATLRGGRAAQFGPGGRAGKQEAMGGAAGEAEAGSDREETGLAAAALTGLATAVPRVPMTDPSVTRPTGRGAEGVGPAAGGTTIGVGEGEGGAAAVTSTTATVRAGWNTTTEAAAIGEDLGKTTEDHLLTGRNCTTLHKSW